jgi:hypothetical protein
MKPLFLSILALFLAFVSSGCQAVVSPNRSFSDVGLTYHREDVVLKDIPLPEDFVALEGSFCYGSEAFRYGEFVYRGLLSVDDLFYYYKEQMPRQNWETVSSQQFETHARIKFQNNYELCTILFREGDQSTDIKIIVEQKKS